VTRGFWLGLAAAAVTFLVLAFARERASAAQRRR
jgi:hypothetical protein